MDFFSDGRAAISTWNGDVWIVSGIDDKLQKLSWKRYAAGLFEPLGLKIVNNELFVGCRDQIMHLHDLNHDGEADYYETFFNENPINASYHSFTFDLQADSAGNFYYIRCGQRVESDLPLSGGMVRVSKDGSKAELIAHGLRAANGMSIGPHDEITCADNQGNWVPTSRIDFIKPGRFFGYTPHAHTAATPTTYEPPLCWIPYALDNSSGGQIWVTSDKWGPFQNQVLHTSYGKASLFLVMFERDGERAQGATVQFPLKFESGIMRGRFNPLDGQLYLCGLKGWQTSGARDGALHRVRYTGGKVYMPMGLHVLTNGIRIDFTCALQKESAEDIQNYALEQWTYLWSEKYGSPEFSVADPKRQGHDPVELKSARLQSGGRSVFLEIPSIRPVMQMKIQFRLKAEDGATVAQTIYNTINYLQ
jgi:glucose/arabinose dehydrogenase